MYRKDLSRMARGVTLIEALVAMAVMGISMLAIMHAQRTIRWNGDVVRQMAQAHRIATDKLDEFRAFTSLDNNSGVRVGPDSAQAWIKNYGDIASTNLPSVVRLTGIDDTAYSLNVDVSRFSLVPSSLQDLTIGGPSYKLVAATTSFNDRMGSARTASIYTIIAGVDPATTARVAMPKPQTVVQQANARNITIPASGKDVIWAGRPLVAFKPFDNAAGEVWMHDRTTGDLVASCTGVATAQASISQATIDSASCSAVTRMYFVSGTVRFDLRNVGSGSLDSEVSRNPQGPALPLSAATPLRFASGSTVPSTAPAPKCYSGSAYAVAPSSTPSAIDYYCVVTLASGTSGWGGKLDVVSDGSWTIATSPSNYRICRYTPYLSTYPDYAANVWHPRSYCMTDGAQPGLCVSPVNVNLTLQNFLVVRGQYACPVDSVAVTNVANQSQGAYVDTNTRQHQP